MASASEETTNDPLSSTGYDQNTILRSLRAHNRTLRTRLLSIEHDARRAHAAHQALTDPPLPLFGNARAGLWYTAPPAYSCSFKSADGHYGQWASSPRRPNLHVLRAVLDAGGVVIVDVTRAGKRVPDALSKTVPMWCAVLNALIRSSCSHADIVCQSCLDDGLHVHPSISPNERAAIASQLPHFVAGWTAAGMRDHPLIAAARTARPLRCVWTFPARDSWPDGLPLSELSFAPIVCISASDAVAPGARAHVEAVTEEVIAGMTFPSRPSFPYVQGAGDDEEAWAANLTPALFWARRCDLLAAAPDGIDENTIVEERVRTLINNPPAHLATDPPRRIWETGLSVVRAPISQLRAVLRDIDTAFNLVVVLGAADPTSHEEVVDGRDTSSKTGQDSKEGLHMSEDPKVIFFPLTDKRGKLELKYAFGRALGPCLQMLRDYCVDRAGETLVYCTSRSGDWAAGLAIAWLIWHCQYSTDELLTDAETDWGRSEHKDEDEEKYADAEGEDEEFDTDDAFMVKAEEAPVYRLCRDRRKEVGTIGKDKVHATMLRFSSSFPDFQISRVTLKQLNRFFSSPEPSSTVSDSAPTYTG